MRYLGLIRQRYVSERLGWLQRMFEESYGQVQFTVDYGEGVGFRLDEF